MIAPSESTFFGFLIKIETSKIKITNRPHTDAATSEAPTDSHDETGNFIKKKHE